MRSRKARTHTHRKERYEKHTLQHTHTHTSDSRKKACHFSRRVWCGGVMTRVKHTGPPPSSEYRRKKAEKRVCFALALPWPIHRCCLTIYYTTALIHSQKQPHKALLCARARTQSVRGVSNWQIKDPPTLPIPRVCFLRTQHKYD